MMAPRPTISQLFPMDCIVQTPLGKRARVVGYDDDGRLQLRYEGMRPSGGDNITRMSVDLWPNLCKRLTT